MRTYVNTYPLFIMSKFTNKKGETKLKIYLRQTWENNVFLWVMCVLWHMCCLDWVLITNLHMLVSFHVLQFLVFIFLQLFSCIWIMQVVDIVIYLLSHVCRGIITSLETKETEITVYRRIISIFSLISKRRFQNLYFVRSLYVVYVSIFSISFGCCKKQTNESRFN